MNTHARSLFTFILLVAALVAVTGCRQRPTPAPIPTLAVLPPATDTPEPPVPTRTPFPTWTWTPSATDTLTYTPTFTRTNTRTFTPTPTFTLTPTLTPSNTFTLTYTPSITLTPSRTRLPTLTPSDTRVPTDTPTPTASLTPSNTPIPSATRTDTPIPSPTVLAPTITSFVSNASAIIAGTGVSFSWSAVGDTAQLEQFTSTGAVLQSQPIPVSGDYTLVPSQAGGRQTFFRLVVTRGTLVDSRTLSVQLTCSTSWFFGDQFVPANAGCPAAVGAAASGNFQRFERGFMIYVTANGLNRIVAAQDADQRYLSIPNSWDGRTENTTPAPGGLFAPQQMFNWVYYTTLSPSGTWNSVLGWAVMNIDIGTRTIQYEGSVGGNSPFYIDTADGAVYRFSGGDSGIWTRVR